MNILDTLGVTIPKAVDIAWKEAYSLRQADTTHEAVLLII